MSFERGIHAADPTVPIVDPTDPMVSRRGLLKGAVGFLALVLVPSACSMLVDRETDAHREGETLDAAFREQLRDGASLEVFPGVLQVGDMVNPRTSPVRIQGMSANSNRAPNIPEDEKLLVVRPYLASFESDGETKIWAGYWDSDKNDSNDPTDLSWVELTNEAGNSTLDPRHMSAFTKSGDINLALTTGDTVALAQRESISPFVIDGRGGVLPGGYEDDAIIDYVSGGAVGIGFRVGVSHLDEVRLDLVRNGYGEGFSDPNLEYQALLDRQSA